VHARVTKGQVPPERIDEMTDYVRANVLPGARGLAGFKGVVALVDRGSGAVFTFTLWESEQAMRDSEEAANRLRDQGASDLAFTPTVERYEVTLMELS
jgi:heme-degrading monooxygenase HmoA